MANSTIEKDKNIKSNAKDTGLRGSFNGDLYIDRNVFFNRPEVIKFLKLMKNSSAYPKSSSPSQ